MKFKDLNPPVVELPSPCVLHRVQLIRPRASSLRMNGLSMPPVGLMQGRFCLSNEPVAYLADSPETGSLRFVNEPATTEIYTVLQSLRIAQTQELAVDCRAMALDGVVYASAQHPQHFCVALFHSGIGQLSKRSSQRLVKTGTNRLLQVLQTALWRSGVPLDES